MTRPRWKQYKPEAWRFGPSCAFCGRDPYEYVDIGVGYQAVAVSCCDEGIAVYQYFDKTLGRIARLLTGDKRQAERGQRRWAAYQRMVDEQAEREESEE
jgi:hypothetical protein